MLKKIIALEGIEIVAPIGYYKIEREKGNTFIIDLSIDELFHEGVDTDEIGNTLNYEKLNTMVLEEMAIECRLLENVAYRIYQRILSLDEKLLAISLSIRKKDPALKGKVKYARVSLEWCIEN